MLIFLIGMLNSYLVLMIFKVLFIKVVELIVILGFMF